jgi:hypothetical protein
MADFDKSVRMLAGALGAGEVRLRFRTRRAPAVSPSGLGADEMNSWCY